MMGGQILAAASGRGARGTRGGRAGESGRAWTTTLALGTRSQRQEDT